MALAPLGTQTLTVDETARSGATYGGGSGGKGDLKHMVDK
jgi:hypothetical protein